MSNKKRYFYVTYSFKGGIGSTTIECCGMLNHQEFKRFVVQTNIYNGVKIESVFITNLIEMSEEDFMAFTNKDDLKYGNDQ